MDDTLILCQSLSTLQAFKHEFLTCFEGPDEGPITEYLGCDIVCDSKLSTLTINQTADIWKVLAFHGMVDANPVKTPM